MFLNLTKNDKLTDSEKEIKSDDEEEEGYCSDKGNNHLSMTWSKEEMENQSITEEENSRKRSGSTRDENDRSKNDDYVIDNNVEGRNTLTNSDKRQKLIRRAEEGDTGRMRQNTTKEQVRR